MGAGVHLYQMTCWQTASGKWCVNDVKNLGGNSGKWYVPMRILDISVEDYINTLLKYKAEGIYYYAPTDYLGFYFTKEKDAKAFCSYVNKIARQKNYCCA